MSTRSTIHFKDEYQEVIIYRHSDGYPAVGGYDIHQFLEQYGSGLAPYDVSYDAAHFLVWLAGKYQRSDDRLDFLSVGIYQQDPGDIEYRYTVLCDGSGEVYIQQATGTDEQGERQFSPPQLFTRDDAQVTRTEAEQQLAEARAMHEFAQRSS